MKFYRRTVAVFTAAIVGCQTVWAQENDEEAEAIWRGAAEQIQSAQSFSTTANISYDVVQPAGRKLQFGGEYRLKVSRPDKLHTYIRRDDGQEIELFFDGETITLVNVTEKLYASHAYTGTVGAAVEAITDVLNIAVPLGFLTKENLADALAERFAASAYIGPHSINNEPAEHLLLASEDLDLQLWITTDEDASLQQVLITYAQESGAPQYTARFKDWQLGKKLSDKKFTFEPTDGFEQIEFLETQD